MGKMTTNALGLPSEVAVVEHKSFEEDVVEAFELIGYEVPQGKLVLIKPNLCGEAEPTSVGLISALAKLFHERSERLVVGETNSTTKRAHDRIKLFNIDEVVKRFGGEAQDLTKTPIVEVNVTEPLRNERLPLPKLVVEADVLVNVPLLRRHRTTRVTCCMKNLYGLLATTKFRYHIRRVVHETIVEVNTVLKPSVNVVDGTLGGKGVLMVGRSPYFVDLLAARLLGYEPRELKLLRLASERFGLPLGPERVDIRGLSFGEAYELLDPIRRL